MYDETAEIAENKKTPEWIAAELQCMKCSTTICKIS